MSLRVGLAVPYTGAIAFVFTEGVASTMEERRFQADGDSGNEQADEMVPAGRQDAWGSPSPDDFVDAPSDPDDALFESIDEPDVVAQDDDSPSEDDDDGSGWGPSTPWEHVREAAASHRVMTGVAACALGVAVVIGGFALAINLTLAHAQEGMRDEGASAGYVRPVDHADLPYIPMRFLSFDDTAFPALSINLHLSAPSDQGLPALGADDFVVRETDAEQRSFDPAIGGLALDAATGACRIDLTSDPAALGAKRTIDISLSPDCGYRGGCRISYTMPGA